MQLCIDQFGAHFSQHLTVASQFRTSGCDCKVIGMQELKLHSCNDVISLMTCQVFSCLRFLDSLLCYYFFLYVYIYIFTLINQIYSFILICLYLFLLIASNWLRVLKRSCSKKYLNCNMQNMAQTFSLVPLVLDPTGRTGSYWMIPLAFVLFWFDIYDIFVPAGLPLPQFCARSRVQSWRDSLKLECLQGFFGFFQGSSWLDATPPLRSWMHLPPQRLHSTLQPWPWLAETTCDWNLASCLFGMPSKI